MHKQFAIRLLTVAVSGLILAGGVHAQQFQDMTAALFPAPAPEEFSNQLTIGDIDGDGDLDIVFANGGNFNSPGTPEKVRIYINFGPAFFKDETDARTGGFAGLFRGVELGDCDNDGDLDLLLAQDFDRPPGLLINNGVGQFTSEGATRLPAIDLASSRGQFGDVDNDGDLDIFLPDGGASRFGCGQYRLYLNNGNCHYTDVTATQFPTGNVCNNMDAIFGDIDGDFDLDLRTASTGSNNSRLYRNDGSGVFSVAAVPGDSTCYSYDFGDVDGDGDLDLLGANGLSGSSSEILLENDGSGSFTNVSGQISPNPNQDDNDSKFLDYDNDGDLDLIIARLGSGGEKIYRNDGNGNFTQIAGVIEVISDSSLDIGVADLDGNGTLDVVTAQGESGSYVNRIYINSGPPDTWPPSIVDTEQLPDTSDTVGPYVVRAQILDQMTSDRNFFDSGIFLTYSVNAGPDQAVVMSYSGGQIYRAQIPGQPAGSTVEYSVFARDFAQNTGIGSPRSFDVTGIGAQPAGDVPDSLRVDRGLGAEITLSWQDSCLGGDSDYAVYEGPLGSFTAHQPRQCSTGGDLDHTFADDQTGLDRYYLVVPRNGSREGSYGVDDGGTERPASTTACLVQSIGSCPP